MPMDNPGHWVQNPSYVPVGVQEASLRQQAMEVGNFLGQGRVADALTYAPSQSLAGLGDTMLQLQGEANYVRGMLQQAGRNTVAAAIEEPQAGRSPGAAIIENPAKLSSKGRPLLSVEKTVLYYNGLASRKRLDDFNRRRSEREAEERAELKARQHSAVAKQALNSQQAAVQSTPEHTPPTIDDVVANARWASGLIVAVLTIPAAALSHESSRLPAGIWMSSIAAFIGLSILDHKITRRTEDRAIEAYKANNVNRLADKRLNPVQ